MDLGLVGRVALVTGSSGGIGAAIAKALAAEGAAVAVHGRNAERAAEVAEVIVSAGGRAVDIVGDLSGEGVADRIADEAVRRLGRVDILVNNVGDVGGQRGWDDTGLEAWRALFETNVLGGVALVQRLLPSMRSAGWGRIVNVTSFAGTMPLPSGPEYAASKAAIAAATISLAKSVAGSGVTINAVSPGVVHTGPLETTFRGLAAMNGWAERDAEWAQVEAAVLGKAIPVPVGRVGRPEEIANAVAFLCGAQAGYVTGVELRVDGGLIPSR